MTMNVHVYHVGSPHPTILADADFHTEGEGDLIVNRDAEMLAKFPHGKWSAAIKMISMNSTATNTRSTLSP